jgi:DNA-3-methyladenine glycosylase II
MQTDKISLEDVQKCFEKDLLIRDLLKKFGLPKSGVEMDVFNALVRSIVSQQLSIKAAQTIYQRFRALFSEKPSPKSLKSVDHETLREVGLSHQKARYVQNVAQFFEEKNLQAIRWDDWSDEEVINMLTEIKGVGTWTVQMLLMFTLGRQDVFPVDDLGIQQGMKRFYGLEEEGKELKNKLVRIADRWKPYRSIASKLIWIAKDST